VLAEEIFYSLMVNSADCSIDKKIAIDDCHGQHSEECHRKPLARAEQKSAG
jgi:hypothetical protein